MRTTTVLVVEDNPGDQEIIATLLDQLTERTWRVVGVGTLAEALRKLAGEPRPDVVLLDLHLPDAAGLDVVRKLAARAPKLPIIVLTGSMTEADAARQALKEGAEDFVLKDKLTPDTLRRAIDYSMERKAFGEKLAQSEERFRQLADNTDSIFWILSNDLSEVIYVNAAFDRVTGSTRERLYADPSEWSRITHPDDRAHIIESFRKLAQGEAPFDARFRIRRPDNTIRWLHIRGFTIRDSTGEIYRIGGTADDVTALHESEARLDKARREAEEGKARLEELQRLRVEFFNLMAHELNNPLTIMTMQVDLLRMLGALTPEQSKAVATLERGTKKLAGLTRDLLDVSRLQSGDMKVRLAPVDLRDLVDESISTYELLAEKNGITLRVTGESSLPAQGDARRITQVLTNFLTNSLKFTLSGGEIIVKVAKDGHDAVISVTDTGMGLSDAQIQQLFAPFKQARPEDASKGTGLGLYVSRGIAAAHGGSVGCSSPGVGRGSTFWLRLPMGPAATSTQADVNSPRQQNEGG